LIPHPHRVQVLFLSVSPGIEDATLETSRRVQPVKAVSFVKVAGSAGKRQNSLPRPYLRRFRNDVFNLKRKIEHGFRRSAVFAAVTGTRRNQSITGIHLSSPASGILARRRAA
jgi:hypothetical protein